MLFILSFSKEIGCKSRFYLPESTAERLLFDLFFTDFSKMAKKRPFLDMSRVSTKRNSTFYSNLQDGFS